MEGFRPVREVGVGEAFTELSVHSVGAYLEERHGEIWATQLGGALLDVEERSDGNLNHVFVVRGAGGTAVCVKQALPFMRLIPAFALGAKRIYFEHACLTWFQEQCPGCVPKVLAFDEEMACILMEFVAPHRVLRKAIAQAPDGLSTSVGRLAGDRLARALFPSTTFAMSGERRRVLEAYFCQNDELCSLTEEAIFTCPFVLTGKPTFPNKWTSPHLDATVQSLQRDEAVLTEVARLKSRFMTSKEALLHGDLHTGSVLASGDGDVRFFDLEFALMGPMAFDVGLLLGNLLLGACSHHGVAGQGFAAQQATELWLAFESRFRALWFAARLGINSASSSAGIQAGRVAICLQAHVSGEGVLNRVLRRTWLDAQGFAACEMIRRTIGIAHVEDFERIESDKERSAREALALHLARRLMLRPAADIGAFRTVVRDHLEGANARKRDVCLYLVAKFPQLGRCKTRLASGVGDETALGFAQSCIADIVHNLGGPQVALALQQRMDGEPISISRRILFSGEQDAAKYREWLDSSCGEHAAAWDLQQMADTSDQPQMGKLGAALGAALEAAAARGSSAVGFIGMDTPELAVEDVVAALAASLGPSPLAHICPASDGGYVLLSLPAGLGARVFQNVSWSTPAAFATQVSAVQRAGCGIAVGRLYEDVDEVASYESLRARLARQEGGAELPALRRHFGLMA